jgi:hypothetical protein
MPLKMKLVLVLVLLVSIAALAAHPPLLLQRRREL